MSRTKAKRYADKHTAKDLKKSQKERLKLQKDSYKNDVSNVNNLNVDFKSILNTNVTSSNIKYEQPANKINSPYQNSKNKSNVNDNYNSKQKNTNKKSPKNKSKNLFFNIIIIICLIAIFFSSYKIIVWFIENQKSKNMLSDIHGKVTVYEEKINIDDTLVTKRTYDLSKLIEKNSDTVGWIYVKNTNVDYPVVQCSDNDYYLNHSFDKSENSAGWVFADFRSDCQNLGYNTVIYGHNRKDQSMFGSLKNVLDPEWYSSEDNLYINFAALNDDHVYKVFSTFICSDQDVNEYTQTSFSSDAEFSSYVQNLKRLSSYNFNTDISNTSEIITLYTCYGLNNQRLLVCATLVE